MRPEAPSGHKPGGVENEMIVLDRDWVDVVKPAENQKSLLFRVQTGPGR